MKGFTVREARARFGDLLDAAEGGDPVVIERHGVRFVLQAEPSPGGLPVEPLFAWLDPAVEAGDWTWQASKAGLTFKARGRKRGSR